MSDTLMNLYKTNGEAKSQSAEEAGADLPLFDRTPLQESGLAAPRQRQLLQYYLEDLSEQLAQAREAVHKGDAATVGAIAHSLKSSSRQVGALRLGEGAWHLEQAARESPVAANLPEAMAMQLGALQALAELTTESLTSHLNEAGA